MDSYYDTSLEKIRRKFTRWAYSSRLARSQGYTAKQFTTMMLSKIKILRLPVAIAQ